MICACHHPLNHHFPIHPTTAFTISPLFTKALSRTHTHMLPHPNHTKSINVSSNMQKSLKILTPFLFHHFLACSTTLSAPFTVTPISFHILSKVFLFSLKFINYVWAHFSSASFVSLHTFLLTSQHPFVHPITHTPSFHSSPTPFFHWTYASYHWTSLVSLNTCHFSKCTQFYHLFHICHSSFFKTMRNVHTCIQQEMTTYPTCCPLSMVTSLNMFACISIRLQLNNAYWFPVPLTHVP